jgi:hypothetical protein
MQKFCSTGGTLAAEFPLPPGSTYELVVARNGAREGSYGHASGGAEIPLGSVLKQPHSFPTSYRSVSGRAELANGEMVIPGRNDTPNWPDSETKNADEQFESLPRLEKTNFFV